MRPRARALLICLIALCGLGAAGDALAQAAPAPAADVRRLPGAWSWGFAVDDGGAEPVLSAERRDAIVAARLPPNGAPPAWRPIVTAADVGAKRLSDHAHVFAHDAHWIAFATDRGSFLVKLDRKLGQQALVAVADASLPTNDMFMIAEPDGVAVAHFLPGTGHRIFRFAPDATRQGTAELGGGAAVHAGGASALAMPDGYLVLAPQSLQPDTPGGILAIAADTDWQVQSVRFLVAEDGRNIARASAVVTADGGMILHARVRTAAGSSEPSAVQSTERGATAKEALEKGAPEQRAARQGASDGDGGDIVRYRIDAEGRVRAREVVAPGPQANRPYTALIAGRLYTLWDTSGAVWMKSETASR